MLIENDPRETNGKPQPATNDPEEVIDTPDKVEESNDEKIDQDFPGYPHYPAKDDLLNPENFTERLDIDVENLTRSHTISPEHLKNRVGTPELERDFTQVAEEEEEIEMNSGTDADVTAEDLALLGARDEDMDLGEDEELKTRGWQPVTGKDLDLPFGEPSGDEAPGEEDEENSYYSFGGDEMQKLEESDDQNNF